MLHVTSVQMLSTKAGPGGSPPVWWKAKEQSWQEMGVLQDSVDVEMGMLQRT